MSSPRKCRGIEIIKKEWVYGWYVEWNGHCYIEYSRPGFPWYDNIRVEVIPETVGQYTGRRDVTSKDAYHGDIVKSKHYGVGEIVWRGDSWAVMADGMGYSLNYDFTIIGNIHQNKSLLETDK